MPILLWVIFPFAIWSACVPGVSNPITAGKRPEGLDATEGIGPQYQHQRTVVPKHIVI